MEKNRLEKDRWELSGMDQGPSKALNYNSRENTKKGKGRECCMCGDVGFQECLFRCHGCQHRFQHIYCSMLYCDQLALNGLNVCDWCLDLEEKQKIQSHKRKVRLREPESRKIKVVATIEKPKKINAMPTLKVPVKFEGSKQNQASSLLQGCKLSAKSCESLPVTDPPQSSPTKTGLGRRYKLLSDVLC